MPFGSFCFLAGKIFQENIFGQGLNQLGRILNLADEVRYYKEDTQGVKVMCKIMEEILDEGRERCRKEGRKEGGK